MLIRTPRNADVMGAILGVLRAGAAFILVEENYPEERVEYIRKRIDVL